MGINISGIIYNILVKAKLRQGEGETEEEFQTRRAELLAKSKTGKTTATRKQPESDEEYQARLLEKYANDPMFHREELFISQDAHVELQWELWELTQQYLNARRRNTWYRNTSYCFNWGSPCQYFAICRSGENPLVIENEYRIERPHGELDIECGSSVSAPPVF
jgi:hypothetical protein